MYGNGIDPSRDLGFGSDQSDFSKAGGFKFAKAKYDDSKWRTLNLPHDWAVELPFVRDEGLQGHGYKPLGRKYPETSVGWYRKTFTLPKEDEGKRIVIEFEGIFRDALLFVNGYFIGRNDNGYTPFSFDLSDYLVYGGVNAIAVRVDASFGEGWFYEGAGIYRHVWLTITDPVHLVQWGNYVRTEVEGKVATLKLAASVSNESAFAASTTVYWKILDSAGKVVASAETPERTVPMAGEREFLATAKLAEPALWSPDTPNLYTAVVQVESAGKVLDRERVTFGVRTIRFDADKGFFLNEQPVKIKGTCNHQDHAGVGAAVPDALQWYRLAVLKGMSSNAVRTSHNMPSPAWVAACDRMGMMMMCETRNAASTPEGKEQLSVMLRHYRNSPSIILWSIANEEGALQKEAIGERVGVTMVAHAHALDPTRQVTAAINNSFETGISKELDVEGFNYNLKAIDAYRERHPHKALFGSETASTVSTRGVYLTDKPRNWESAYDVNAPSWGETAEEWWNFYAKRDYLAGGFAWTGFDYRGEPTPYGWPSINSQFGIVDMCGFPKDNYFYYKASWGTEQVLHLFPHWNWEDRLGEPVMVWVYSNLEAVELFLNGKSMGSQKVVPLSHLEWKVKYEPGTLEARGSREGKVILIEKRETTGTVSSLRVTAHRGEIDANGEDLAIFKVEALDGMGRAIPTADNLIQFKLVGECALLGVGNGDPNCQESDKEPRRSLFMGLVQVIVQAGKKPGPITLEAYTKDFSGPKLPTAKATVTMRRVEARPAI